MTDEHTMKLTDFDYLTGDHHLQMIKAALPYVSVPQQRLLSVLVKIRELQRTMSLFQEEEVAAMGISALPETQKGSALDMMEAIKPYGNTQEQDLIDMVCNFIRNVYTGNQRQELFPLPQTFDPEPPASLSPGPVSNGTVSNGTIPPDSSSMDMGETGGSHYGSSVFPPVSSPQQSGPMPSAIGQLKNFLPPDQQSRLEQAAFLMQTLQQLT